MGAAAEVYWSKDKTKYTIADEDGAEEPLICEVCGDLIKGTKNKSPEQIAQGMKKATGLCMCIKCYRERAEKEVEPHE